MRKSVNEEKISSDINASERPVIKIPGKKNLGENILSEKMQRR